MGRRVPGGVEHVRVRAMMLHETGNGLVLTDCFNNFETVQWAAVLEEVATCVPALTTLVHQCYGTRPVGVSFRTDPGETKTVSCSRGVQQADTMQ